MRSPEASQNEAQKRQWWEIHALRRWPLVVDATSIPFSRYVSIDMLGIQRIFPATNVYITASGKTSFATYNDAQNVLTCSMELSPAHIASFGDSRMSHLAYAKDYGEYLNEQMNEVIDMGIDMRAYEKGSEEASILFAALCAITAGIYGWSQEVATAGQIAMALGTYQGTYSATALMDRYIRDRKHVNPLFPEHVPELIHPRLTRLEVGDVMKVFAH